MNNQTQGQNNPQQGGRDQQNQQNQPGQGGQQQRGGTQGVQEEEE